MRPLINKFLWIGLLASGLQSASAYSLLGPSATFTTAPQGDLWQVIDIGYNPIPSDVVPPFLVDGLAVGPKNIGEGYRRNSPVMYYAFDPSFTDWFHSEGEGAVQQAFDLLNNSFTNNPSGAIDGYSPVLSEFPLNSQGQNFTASSLGLLDVKSETLSLMMEQLGLVDAIRYTWTLHNRVVIPGCTAPCPDCLEYLVVMRNYDYYLTPLGYVPPDWGQYSPYVNGELFGYQILEDCGIPVTPDADAYEIPVNPTVNNPPVASGIGLGALRTGIFYTGLTRDDAAGLRWLYSTNNYDTPSAAHLESPAAGSVLNSINLTTPQLLFTSNYNALVSASLTNSPAALQALFPGLVVGATPVFTYFSNVVSPNVIAFFTNFVGQPADAPATAVVVTNLVTNIVQFYQNTFGNVVTDPLHRIYTNTTFAIQTISVGPVIGQPVGTPFVTNISYSFFQSNVPSGDYFIISNGFCNPNIIQTLQTNVNIVTNALVGVTNINGQSFVQNLISYFTNYVFVTQPCTQVINAIANYRGIGKMQFVRVPDYDYLSGFFTQLITNQYAMVVFTNGQYVTENFQRVLTAPDFIFRAQDLELGPAGGPTHGPTFTRNINLNQATELAGHAGPGTIDPATTITFNEVGPDYVNQALFDLFGPNAVDRWFIWGSFDGSTNTPIVYPNGQVANLAAEALIQIAPPPPNLPTGTNGVAYTNALTVVAGGQAPYNWMLTSGSAGLPPGLNLSPNGVISGTPTQSGTFDNIVIQLTDSTVPIARAVNLGYSITIN
jgi:hypothetical protein